MEFMGIIAALIYGVVCGYVSKAINNNRGKEGGFWWGFSWVSSESLLLRSDPKIEPTRGRKQGRLRH